MLVLLLLLVLLLVALLCHRDAQRHRLLQWRQLHDVLCVALHVAPHVRQAEDGIHGRTVLECVCVCVHVCVCERVCVCLCMLERGGDDCVCLCWHVWVWVYYNVSL